jgi:hypothetical protein
VPSSLRQKLIGFAQEQSMVTLQRPFPGEPSESGFILGVGEELLLFRPFHYFYPEGYSVFPSEDVEAVTHGEREQLIESIIKRESIIELNAGPWSFLSLDAWPMLAAQILADRCFVSLQCESRDWQRDDEFLVGRVLGADDASVTLRCFDSTAVWVSEPHTVYYSSITRINLDTPYVNILSKYVRKPKRRGE